MAQKCGLNCCSSRLSTLERESLQYVKIRKRHDEITFWQMCDPSTGGNEAGKSLNGEDLFNHSG